MISLRLPSEVNKKIQWLADQKYTDKSSIHRDALRVYLIENDDFFTDDYLATQGVEALPPIRDARFKQAAED